MLIEFSVKNFRSIREKQTLSMAASTGAELREQNTFDSGISKLPHLLKVAVIYGPNAAGKSNLLHAMYFMKRFIKVSSKESQERGY